MIQDFAALAVGGCAPTGEKAAISRTRVQAGATELHTQPGRVRISQHGHIVGILCDAIPLKYPPKISSITSEVYKKAWPQLCELCFGD